MADPNTIQTIEDLEKEYEKVFLLKDRGLVRVVCATIIANRMSLDPVWMLLIAPSSGGKSEIIQAISGLEFVHPISDLTPNTFASGQKKVGRETSLLLRLNNGIMAFKDFTSLLSKNREARQEIMGQLREIYDGQYVKHTGTGESVVWRGKVGAIAGSTEAIYSNLNELSAMGDRFIMYMIEQPDRIEVARRVLENAHNMQEKREHLQQCFKHYILGVIEKMNEDELELAPEVKENLLIVADFATRVRSAVLTDFKTGLVDFVPSQEMPMRVTSQLYTIASGFMAMRKSEPKLLGDASNSFKLSELEQKLLYKIAFDSIPRNRRDILHPLAQYAHGVRTKGLAAFLNLPTASVGKQLSHINALGICRRFARGGKDGDLWKMPDEYRKILIDLEHIEVKDTELRAPDGYEDSDVDAHETLEEYYQGREEEISLDPPAF